MEWFAAAPAKEIAAARSALARCLQLAARPSAAVRQELTLAALALDSEVLVELLGLHVLDRPELLGIAALSCLVLAT